MTLSQEETMSDESVTLTASRTRLATSAARW